MLEPQVQLKQSPDKMAVVSQLVSLGRGRGGPHFPTVTSQWTFELCVIKREAVACIGEEIY